MGAVAHVILSEALADFAGAYADDADVGEILGGIAAEDFDGEGAFLEVLGVAFQNFGDYEVEEILTAFTAAENGACQNSIELVAHFGGIGTAG
jgi:hypothetical protein